MPNNHVLPVGNKLEGVVARDESGRGRVRPTSQKHIFRGFVHDVLVSYGYNRNCGAAEEGG